MGLAYPTYIWGGVFMVNVANTQCGVVVCLDGRFIWSIDFVFSKDQRFFLEILQWFCWRDKLFLIQLIVNVDVLFLFLLAKLIKKKQMAVKTTFGGNSTSKKIRGMENNKLNILWNHY